MSLLYQCLSADDLKDLTQEDLEMLQRIIEHELHTSTGIKRILRACLKSLRGLCSMGV